VKRPMFIEVRGNQHRWSFNFDGDPAHLADWRADGLEVNVIEGSVPYGIAGTLLMRPWLWLQRAWQWLRMW
jgi:hypothetical protein